MGLFSKSPEEVQADEDKRRRLGKLQEKISKYKPSWDKDGVIQYVSYRNLQSRYLAKRADDMQCFINSLVCGVSVMTSINDRILF